MADEAVITDEITTSSRRLESINADNSNQNISSRLENNECTSIANMNPVYCSKLRSEYKRCDEKLPAINLPEKILLVVDAVRENNCSPFEFEGGTKYTPLQMIKRVIEIFIRTKGSINRKHEYALMMLNTDSVEYLCDYTNNEKKILMALSGVNEIPLPAKQEYFDLTSCFAQILSLCPIETGVENPSYVHRVILIYARSNSLPILTMPTVFDSLMTQKYFFFDALFVHEPLTDENTCEEVYKRLSNFDVKQNSWILEVGRNAALLHATMAKLLAHPLQRPKQHDAEYKVFFNDNNEIQTNV